MFRIWAEIYKFFISPITLIHVPKGFSLAEKFDASQD